MSIKDIYKNLNKDMESISKRKKSQSFESILKKSFNPFVGAERYANDTAVLDVSLESFNSYINESANASVVERDALRPLQDPEGIQHLRHIFGKGPFTVEPKIGSHPEFAHLGDDNSTKTGYTVTMFMDIVGSTKLGISYSPEDVFLFKNSIITGAIQTITAFDGHVHRIMGDAVMAFFRSKDNEDNNTLVNSAIDAINCASYFIRVMDELVKPQISEVANEDIGIRIGIELGEKNWVLWGNYGVPGINEVTATSFFVDIASKLQQKARKNCIMLGERLVKELDFTTKDFISIKKNGDDEERYAIDVTIDKQRLRYRQYEFNQDDYFSCLPHGLTPSRLKITAEYGVTRYSENRKIYKTCSSAIPKNRWIKYTAYFTEDYPGQYDNVRFKFRVENHGKEAALNLNNGNHETPVDKKAQEKENGVFVATCFEQTLYKGFHHMFVSVISNGVEVEKETKFTIFIL